MLADRRRGAAAGSSALVASASEAGARCDRSGPWATAAVAVALLSLLAAPNESLHEIGEIGDQQDPAIDRLQTAPGGWKRQQSENPEDRQIRQRLNGESPFVDRHVMLSPMLLVILSGTLQV